MDQGTLTAGGFQGEQLGQPGTREWKHLGASRNKEIGTSKGPRDQAILTAGGFQGSGDRNSWGHPGTREWKHLGGMQGLRNRNN
jgi:hypothetical protein